MIKYVAADGHHVSYTTGWGINGVQLGHFLSKDQDAFTAIFREWSLNGRKGERPIADYSDKIEFPTQEEAQQYAIKQGWLKEYQPKN